MSEQKYWLDEWDRNQMISVLIKEGIIMYDPTGNLPLKSGGTTDIYVNLRNMRSHPRIIRVLASAYAKVIRELNVNRIVEVPDAVSVLAGVISVKIDIPIVTIREEKSARVTKGKIVGDLKPGEAVAIIDDVITDGASKFPLFRTILSAGARIAAIVVLVDRDQGWRDTIPQTDVPVLAGMSLVHIREHLKAHPEKV